MLESLRNSELSFRQLEYHMQTQTRKGKSPAIPYQLKRAMMLVPATVFGTDSTATTTPPITPPTQIAILHSVIMQHTHMMHSPQNRMSSHAMKSLGKREKGGSVVVDCCRWQSRKSMRANRIYKDRSKKERYMIIKEERVVIMIIW